MRSATCLRFYPLGSDRQVVLYLTDNALAVSRPHRPLVEHVPHQRNAAAKAAVRATPSVPPSSHALSPSGARLQLPELAQPPETDAEPCAPRRTVKSMGELNVEGTTNAWKESGNGRPQSDVTNPALAEARPVLGKAHLGAITESTSMVQPPTAEFLQKNVWHNNTNTGILSTVQPGARMDFRRRKSDVTRC